MYVKNKNNLNSPCSLSHLLTRSSAHFPTFPPAHLLHFPPARSCKGFTLIETIAVVAIISFSVFLMAGIWDVGERANQEHFTQTVKKMAEIKKALLGVHSRKVDLRQGFGGFISHMGGLPPLNDDCQPEGLWKWDQPEDDDGWKGEFRIKNYDMSENGCPAAAGNFNRQGPCDKNWTYMGWRGPYIEPPEHGIIRDGWGNPFIFEALNGDLQITSPGANRVVDENDKDYDEDIITIITRNQYMCSVAGYVDVSQYSHGLGDGPGSTGMFNIENLRVVMHYPVINGDGRVVDHRKFLDGNDIEEDGYFRIEDVPVGFRFILAWEEKFDDLSGWPPIERREEGDHPFNSYFGPSPAHGCCLSEKVKNLKYFLEPGENWIGHMSLQIDTHGRFSSYGSGCPYPMD